MSWLGASDLQRGHAGAGCAATRSGRCSPPVLSKRKWLQVRVAMDNIHVGC